ncbi:hypothetical protein [Azospirillum sp.]|uniref:hypothetical protein n=1 Tax=Azospirillum sp. TaxID=34012 RepID=UPI003D723B4C
MAKSRAGKGFMAIGGLAALLALGGCGDRVLDTGLVGSVFGGGPPPDAPTPIRGMSGENKTFPNLATVPPRPTDVPSLEQRQKDMTALEQERAQARAAAKELEEKYKPVPVPPKPKG